MNAVSPIGLSPCPIGRGHYFFNFSLHFVDNYIIIFAANFCSISTSHNFIDGVNILWPKLSYGFFTNKASPFLSRCKLFNSLTSIVVDVELEEKSTERNLLISAAISYI